MEGGEYKVPCQRGLDGNFSGFQIPDFSNQDYIWVLPYDRAQSFGKGKINFWIYLNLSYAFDLILYGIFYSNDIDLRVVYGGNGRIESRCFATSRGACYQNNSVW